MKLIYWIINSFLLVFLMVDFFLGSVSNKDIKVQMISYIIVIIVVNVFALIAHFLVGKLLNKIFTWIDKRKKDKYSLYDWSGEPVWLEFHEKLSSIKEFDPKSLSKNYERIKVEIKNTFNDRKKLNAFKVYLEVKCESPMLNSLSNSTQSIFIAIITFSFITLVNFTELTQIESLFFFFILIIVWFGLLMVIDHVSKQIDRNKVLLKLVHECIDEETPKRKNRKR